MSVNVGGIVPGMLVGLRCCDTNKEVEQRLRRWVMAYGRGPFYVRGKVDRDHVSL
jgi:hypothetical protein